jgi:hypothetical protein
MLAHPARLQAVAHAPLLVQGLQRGVQRRQVRVTSLAAEAPVPQADSPGGARGGGDAVVVAEAGVAQRRPPQRLLCGSTRWRPSDRGVTHGNGILGGSSGCCSSGSGCRTPAMIECSCRTALGHQFDHNRGQRTGMLHILVVSQQAEVVMVSLGGSP